MARPLGIFYWFRVFNVRVTPVVDMAENEDVAAKAFPLVVLCYPTIFLMWLESIWFATGDVISDSSSLEVLGRSKCVSFCKMTLPVFSPCGL